MESRMASGSCLCGGVRFEIEMPTLLCAHCHCSICRRAHGAPFVTWVIVPAPQFRFVAGEETLIRYRSSDHGTRSSCRRCGSSLIFTSTNRPDNVDVVLANIHDPIDREPQFHVHWDDRADWVRVTDGLPRLGGPTGMEPLES